MVVYFETNGTGLGVYSRCAAGALFAVAGVTRALHEARAASFSICLQPLFLPRTLKLRLPSLCSQSKGEPMAKITRAAASGGTQGVCSGDY